MVGARVPPRVSLPFVFPTRRVVFALSVRTGMCIQAQAMMKAKRQEDGVTAGRRTGAPTEPASREHEGASTCGRAGVCAMRNLTAAATYNEIPCSNISYLSAQGKR
jgi:hypothetical protein